jgi:tetratricopeptide (TPR) repeat protein
VDPLWEKRNFAPARLDAADHSFRQALQLDGSLPQAWNGLGLIQHQRRRYPEAYRSFHTAFELQPDDPVAVLNAAVVAHQQLDHPKLALEKYQTALSLTLPPAQSSTIEALVRQLEEHLHPATPSVQSAPDIVAKTPSKPTAPLAAGTRPTAPRAAAPTATTPAPAASTKPKSASPAATSSARQSSPPATTVPAPSHQPTPSSAPFIVRPTPAPAAPPQEVARATVPPTAAPIREPDLQEPGTSRFPRYRYRSIGVLSPGDRAAAERMVAEGVRLHDRNRISQAIALYQQATQADATHFDAYYNLGVAAYEDGDLATALPAYEAALALEPRSLKAGFNFAVALELAGYPRDAANELEKLLARHPAEARLHLRLGNLYAGPLRDPARTRHHYRQVLELDPRHPQASAIRVWLEVNGS